MNEIFLAYPSTEGHFGSTFARWFISQGRGVCDFGSFAPAGLELRVWAPKAIGCAQECVFVGSFDAIQESSTVLFEMGLAVGAGKKVTLLLPIADRGKLGADASADLNVCFFEMDIAVPGLLRIDDNGNTLFDESPRASRSTLINRNEAARAYA